MIPKLNIDFSIRRAFQSFAPWLKLKNYPPQSGNIFFLNHARTGLRIALSSLGLPKGSKVGMSMYNCLTVMNAIRVAGYEIVFIDITDDLQLDIEDIKRKKKDISALIITHFFGIPNDIDFIKIILAGIPIIEDCAHAYGSVFEDGSDTGSKGDFAVFSTGLGKFPSIGDGGLLLVNNAEYISNVERMSSSLHRYSLIEETKLIIKGFIKYIAYRPYIYNVLLPLKKRKQEKGSFKEMYQHNEAIMPKYVRYLYEKEIPIISDLMYRQQVFASLLAHHLKSVEGVIVPRVLNGVRNGFLFPIIVDDKSKLSKDYFFNQFEKTSHFAKSILWAKEFGYKNDCPNAERITKSIVVLPCNYKIL